MRFYCKNKAYIYFREYVESLLKENDEVILFNDDDKIKIEDDGISSIFLSFVPHIIDNVELIFKNNNKINLFYLNTEQATRPNIQHFINYYLSFLIQIKNKYKENNVEIGIIDYSNQNIKLLNEMKFLDSYEIYYIPYQYNEKENNKLKNFLKCDKKSDVAYCGTDSKYRYDILSKIDSKNIGVNFCTGFFDNRDVKIAQSKILINIHFEKTYNIYESIRCDRWIFAGNLVLSESTIDDSLIDLKNCMVMCRGEDIPSFAEKIIKKYEIYQKLYIKNDNKIKIRNKVIQDRKELYDNFRSKFN